MKKSVCEVSMRAEEFIMHERDRCDCYRLLAACFYPPKKELFLQEHLFKNLAELLRRICPEAAVHAAAMEEAVARYGDEELLVEYARLFVGPYELQAPPYGSVYLDEGRRVMADSTVETVKMYREEGLSMDEDFNEMPDHITAELEFMYYLAFKEVNALERDNIEIGRQLADKQLSFLKKFLGVWASRFCESMKEGTGNTFYRSLADCLAVFIRSELRGNNVAKLPKI
ncbi:MAG: TorD/DmsD family molecular chaperone [Nitrospirota bacterium]